MTPQEIQKIIEQFDASNLKKDAVFGISQYGGGPDESMMRANKEGLEVFALELLKLARDSGNTLNGNESKTVQLSYYDEDWIDENSDILLQYIELLAEKRKIPPKKEYIPTAADKILPFVFMLVILFLGISLIVGIITTFNWLF